jgi:CubicO group peptidase (beta-lactamase class C family)
VRLVRLLPVVLALGLVVPATPAADQPRVCDGLKPFVESGTLAGAVVLVATPDKVLTVEAVGYSDVGAKTPMRTDNLFWIASMSKPITATALMMLVDEGKVGLDDPAEKYLPELKDLMVKEKDQEPRKPKRPPTVRDLLRHTSGMPFSSPAETPTLDRLSLKDGVASYAKTPLQYDPGTKYQYSNAGINTAGRIIEVVSGMPYEEFLQKRLFDPLGMKDTTFWPSEEQVKRLAKAYKPNAAKTGLEETTIGQLKYPLSDRSRQPMPAGGLFSTATDVSTFCRMVLSGGTLGDKRYLSLGAVHEMTGTQTDDLLNNGKGEGGYGLGWSTTRRGRPRGPVIPGPCGHGGAFATNTWIDPDRGLVTVFMVQHAGYPGDAGGKIRPAFEKAAVELYAK